MCANWGLWKVCCSVPKVEIITLVFKWLIVLGSAVKTWPRVINFNFLFQSLTRDISYSMENLAIDSLLI